MTTLGADGPLAAIKLDPTGIGRGFKAGHPGRVVLRPALKATRRTRSANVHIEMLTTRLVRVPAAIAKLHRATS